METKYVVFQLDKERFGVPIDAVERILPSQEVTRLPRTPKMMLGVFDLRGSTIPAVDARLRFDMKEADASLHMFDAGQLCSTLRALSGDSSSVTVLSSASDAKRRGIIVRILQIISWEEGRAVLLHGGVGAVADLAVSLVELRRRRRDTNAEAEGIRDEAATAAGRKVEPGPRTSAPEDKVEPSSVVGMEVSAATSSLSSAVEELAADAWLLGATRALATAAKAYKGNFSSEQREQVLEALRAAETSDAIVVKAVGELSS